QQERLDRLAYYDPLTGLANPMLLRERLTQLATMTQRKAGKFALVLADIERFKRINDALGRGAGDQGLLQMTERLGRLAGDASRIARTGVDQFAVVVPDVKADEQVARIVERGLAHVEGSTFVAGAGELGIALKCGIALFPEDGADADALFRNAEAALKKAKKSGEKYLFYTQQMNERVAERLSLENRLRRAVENDEFELHYQPKVDVRSRAIVGAEALLRWRSPDLGSVPPAQFLPLLEEPGMILQVGAWALNRAALDRRSWLEVTPDAPRIAVNVSPIQLRRRDFVRVL